MVPEHLGLITHYFATMPLFLGKHLMEDPDVCVCSHTFVYMTALACVYVCVCCIHVRIRCRPQLFSTLFLIFFHVFVCV